jgi:hypothetical protein
MTAAERQVRRRQKLKREELERRHQEGQRRAYQPPYGYNRAKEQMIREGHEFERARRDWGFEEGVFVDSAFLSSSEVIELAAMPRQERVARIIDSRRLGKDFACSAVRAYMECMHVSLEEPALHLHAHVALAV